VCVGVGRCLIIITGSPKFHAPAEVTDCFCLASTDGPVEHVAVSCIASHHFRMPAEMLPVALDEPLTSAQRAAERLAGEQAGRGLISKPLCLPR
jgi:hypothetical protein